MAEGQIGVNMGKMYDGEIYEKVSQWFDGHREEMTEDIKTAEQSGCFSS